MEKQGKRQQLQSDPASGWVFVKLGVPLGGSYVSGVAGFRK